MNADENIRVRYFKSCEVDAMRSFYTNTTYKGGDIVNEGNEIVAAYDGEKMVGVFRLCKENGVIVVRGFFILAEYQKKGIGSRMLGLFENELRHVACYLNCRNGLNQFYKRANFEVSEDPPQFLIERVAGYDNKELNILERKIEGE